MPQSRLVTRRPELPELLKTIQPYLPDGTAIWLVGGSVRDQLLGLDSHDLDLVVGGPARRAARAVANGLGADYYDLDRERDTGRLLLGGGPGFQVTLDFSRLDPGGIEQDLKQRDFTINALAIPLQTPESILDMTNGLRDLELGQVRACGPMSVQNDAVRALRAVRLAHQLGFEIEHSTLDQVRRAGVQLKNVSVERIRDEFFRILALPSAGSALRESVELGLLFDVLPELAPLEGMAQPEPHHFDGLEHSLRVADQLARWVGYADASEGLWPQLEPYAERIQAHLAQTFALDRSRRQLLVLAGLLHDVGKPGVMQVTDSGVPRFHGHESVGAEMVVRRGEALHLSRSEVGSLGRVVANHMRPGQLAKEPDLTGRAVYRYFRATGEDGIDICLLALADATGLSDPPPDARRWERRLGVAKRLLEAYFDRRNEEVTPKPLVTGKELMQALGLDQGPLIGRLLEALRQEQAEGRIRSREQALAFATQHLHESEISSNE
ncbi:MAG: HD domain-containing protein [Anaerolineales bacterium]